MLDTKVLSNPTYRCAKYLDVLKGKGRAEVSDVVFPHSWISDLFVFAVRAGWQCSHRTASTTALLSSMNKMKPKQAQWPHAHWTMLSQQPTEAERYFLIYWESKQFEKTFFILTLQSLRNFECTLNVCRTIKHKPSTCCQSTIRPGSRFMPVAVVTGIEAKGNKNDLQCSIDRQNFALSVFCLFCTWVFAQNFSWHQKSFCMWNRKEFWTSNRVILSCEYLSYCLETW